MHGIAPSELILLWGDFALSGAVHCTVFINSPLSFLMTTCFLYAFLLIWSRRSEHTREKTNAQMISFIKTAKDRQRAGFCIPEAIIGPNASVP